MLEGTFRGPETTTPPISTVLPGSVTSQSTADSAAFTAIFEPTLEDDALTKPGDMHIDDAVTHIPKSFAAKIHDRIKIVSTGALWEIMDVDQRVTHDELTLVIFTRV